MSSDGSRVARVTKHGGSQPDWSPTGNQIVYVRNNGRIATINASGRHDRALGCFGRDWVEASPVWSPSGKTIAFLRYVITAVQATTSYLDSFDINGHHRRTLQ